MSFANCPAPDNPKTSAIIARSFLAEVNRSISTNDTRSGR